MTRTEKANKILWFGCLEIVFCFSEGGCFVFAAVIFVVVFLWTASRRQSAWICTLQIWKFILNSRMIPSDKQGCVKHWFMEKLVNTDKTENVYSFSPCNFTSQVLLKTVPCRLTWPCPTSCTQSSTKKKLSALPHVNCFNIFYPKYFYIFVTAQFISYCAHW